MQGEDITGANTEVLRAVGIDQDRRNREPGSIDLDLAYRCGNIRERL